MADQPFDDSRVRLLLEETFNVPTTAQVADTPGQNVSAVQSPDDSSVDSGTLSQQGGVAVVFDTNKDTSKETIADTDMHSPGLQLRRHDSGAKETTVMHGSAEVIHVSKIGRDEAGPSNKDKSTEVAQARRRPELSAETVKPYDHDMTSRSDLKIVGFDLRRHSPFDLNFPSFVQPPLILTAAPQVPHIHRNPNFGVHGGPKFPVAHDIPIALYDSHPARREDLPVFRKLGSHRPPPSTPPEAVTQDRLSMPTLPSLHLTSVPALIEQYRQERRTDPAGFDKHTMAIKRGLVQAKVERGGEANLLNNEYTAELASRLDAEAIERWSVVRQHNEYSVDAESEYDDEDAVYRIPDEIDIPESVPFVPTTYNDFLNIDRKHLSDAPGTITHETRLIREETNNGAETRTYETNIKYTQVVETSKDETMVGQGDKPKAVTPDVEGSGIEAIVNRLANLRTAKGEKISDELMETLEEMKARLKALRKD